MIERRWWGMVIEKRWWEMVIEERWGGGMVIERRWWGMVIERRWGRDGDWRAMGGGGWLLKGDGGDGD